MRIDPYWSPLPGCSLGWATACFTKRGLGSASPFFGWFRGRPGDWPGRRYSRLYDTFGIHDSPPTVFSHEFSSVPRNRPPVVSTGAPVLPSPDVFVMEDGVDPPAPVWHTRPTLDPRQVISTRTRRGTAAAAGVPRPAVDYFPAPDDTPAPAPPSATSIRRSRKSTPIPDPITLEPLIEAPTIPIGSREPSPTPPSGPLLGSNPSSDSRPSIDDSALAFAELDFRESVERYSHADWAREQRSEPVCDAAIRYLILGEPPGGGLTATLRPIARRFRTFGTWHTKAVYISMTRLWFCLCASRPRHLR